MVIVRRIAGALLLFGLFYLYAHVIFSLGDGDGSAAVSDRFPPLTIKRAVGGLIAMIIWSCSIGYNGWELVKGKPNTWWVSIVGLFAYIEFCLALMGNLYFVLDKIHSESTFWFAYSYNILPIVQFMAVCVLGRSHDPDPVPQAS